MNVLHYAVLNENDEMVEAIVFCDAESDRLLNERNYRNQTPAMLDEKGKYITVFNHIWSLVTVNSQNSIEALEQLLSNEKYDVN